MSKFDSDIVFSIIIGILSESQCVWSNSIGRYPFQCGIDHEFSRFSHCLWRKLYCQNPLISEEISNIPTNSHSLLNFFITLCHTRFILPLGISKCNFEPMEAFLNRTNHKICQNMVGEGLLNPIQCIRSSYRGIQLVPRSGPFFAPPGIMVWSGVRSNKPILWKKLRLSTSR